MYGYGGKVVGLTIGDFGVMQTGYTHFVSNLKERTV
jgi:hypothetical protein